MHTLARTRTLYIVQSTLAHTISIMWRGANTKNEVSLKLMKIPFNSKIWAIKSISPSAQVPHWLFVCRKVIAISFGFTRCLFHTIIFLFLFSLRLSPYLNILLPFHLHCYDLLLVISLLSSSVQIWWIVVCVCAANKNLASYEYRHCHHIASVVVVNKYKCIHKIVVKHMLFVGMVCGRAGAPKGTCNRVKIDAIVAIRNDIN